jgi:hypothetical protein
MSHSKLANFGRAGQRGVYKPKHQSCPAVSDRPNFYYVNPLQPPVGVWQGSETFVEFEVPQNMGILKGASLQFQGLRGAAFLGGGTAPVSAPTSAGVAGGWSGPFMPPTPFWISRIEIYVGGDLISTQYDQQHFEDLVNWRSLNEVENYAPLLNVSKFYTPKDMLPESASGSYFLPVDQITMRGMRPFVRGLNSKIRYRFYFPTSVAYFVRDAGSSGDEGANTRLTQNALGDPSVAAVGQMQMVFEEESVDPSVTAELENAHRTGIVDYTCIVEERQQDILTNLVPANMIPLYLRSFRNRSAGLSVCFTDAAPQNGEKGLKYEFSTIQLLDALGRKLTEILPTDYVASVIAAKQFDPPILANMPRNSDSAQNVDGYGPQYSTLLPFSSALQKTLEDACIYGAFPFTALEQLQLTPTPPTYAGKIPIIDHISTTNNASDGNWQPSSTPAGKMVTSVSFSYAHLTIANGNHSFRVESGGR